MLTWRPGNRCPGTLEENPWAWRCPEAGATGVSGNPDMGAKEPRGTSGKEGRRLVMRTRRARTARSFTAEASWAMFLLEFKMDYKAAETIRNINDPFDPGTANEHTVQWWFKKFCQGDENLEDECNSRPSEVDNNQLRAIIKADSLTTTQEAAKRLSVDYYSEWLLQSFSLGSKLERWKSLISGCLMSWPKIIKITIWQCLVFSY